jgi:hypothetical protein
MRAVPQRPLRLVTQALRNGTCETKTYATILGETARLDYVYVKQSWAFGVSYIEFVGHRVSDGASVVERLEP